jgi:hypothetical protein
MRSRRSWRRATVAGLYLLLLTPVPALAAYTLGPWSQIPGSPDNWTILASGSTSASGLNLALTPVGDSVTSGKVTFTFVAQVTSGSSANASVTPSNFNALSVGSDDPSGGLQITIGFSTSSTGSPISLQVYQNTTPNQFNTGPITPPDLSGTGTFAPQSVSSNPTEYAVVQFIFTAPSGSRTNWGTNTAVPSSAVNIMFTGN